MNTNFDVINIKKTLFLSLKYLVHHSKRALFKKCPSIIACVSKPRIDPNSYVHYLFDFCYNGWICDNYFYFRNVFCSYLRLDLKKRI